MAASQVWQGKNVRYQCEICEKIRSSRLGLVLGSATLNGTLVTHTFYPAIYLVISVSSHFLYTHNHKTTLILNYLACSAKLPTGLDILPSVIFLLF